MDCVELDRDEECIEDTSADWLCSPGSPGISDIEDDSRVFPRVGNQYQVEIPSLTDAEDITTVDYPFRIGLPIPIMWVHDEVYRIKYQPLEFSGDLVDVNVIGSTDSENIKDPSPKVELLNDASNNGKELGRLASHGSGISDDLMDVDLPLSQHHKLDCCQKFEGKDYIPVPGLLGNSLSDVERESFLLGLYIFGKNLALVKRFIGNKNMGDLLSFYYGQFYRSDEHRRWSECLNIRNRKCIHGQRIFTGWRQQELLSRLLSHASEECQNALTEVAKSFSEGKVSLEEYVSILKATIGMTSLVEAVGIGKGKYDLTGFVMEPIKSNHVISARCEIPLGKACSSLTSRDIIKFLTGDFRLSKARSSDLFWEAVWPRLLARGWHSEQPRNHCYVNSKHSLVFLIPGVKKFSRRKLVKGDQYFDSVSDVLNKVALDPGLLELEVEAAKGNKTKEDGSDKGTTKSDENGPSDRQPHCYLHPRLSNCNSELMKFTVVDTSLLHGEDPCKVQELRTLPKDVAYTDIPPSSSNGDISEEQVDEPDSEDKLLNDQGDSDPDPDPDPDPSVDHRLVSNTECLFDEKVHSDLMDYVASVSKKEVPMNGPDALKDKYPSNNIMHQFSRRIKSARTNYLTPISKRRRLDACNFSDRSRCTNASSIYYGSKEEPNFRADSLETSEINVAEAGPSQQKIAASSSAKDSPRERSENCYGMTTVRETVLLHENPKHRNLIDLNLPHVPPDFELGEPSFIAEVADTRVESSKKEESFPSETNPHPEGSEPLRTSNDTTVVQEPMVNARRHSTRNRPLTTKALEAFACGFFSSKRRERGPKAMPHENLIPKSSRRARTRVGVLVPTATNFGHVGIHNMDPKAEGVDEECRSNTNMVSKSQIWTENKGTHKLLGARKPCYPQEILTGRDNRSG